MLNRLLVCGRVFISTLEYVFFAESKLAIDAAYGMAGKLAYGMTGNVSIDSQAKRPNTVYRSPVADSTCPDIKVQSLFALLYHSLMMLNNSLLGVSSPFRIHKLMLSERMILSNFSVLIW
jgi:hypothetical protein